MGDLPPDTAIAFVVSKLASATQGATGGDSYLDALSEAMYLYEPYKKLMKGIQDALQKARTGNAA
jgi:hypothetical protein